MWSFDQKLGVVEAVSQNRDHISITVKGLQPTIISYDCQVTDYCVEFWSEWSYWGDSENTEITFNGAS